ncbi:MAG: FHA domain-containing protein, partial [Verrucomicrobiota bacterium]
EMYQRIVPEICKEFLVSSRYDLLDDSRSSQSIQDGLRPFLKALARTPSAPFKARYRDTELETEISGFKLAEALREDIAGILNLVDRSCEREGSPRKHILLTERAGRVPGLLGALEKHHAGSVQVLMPGLAATHLARLVAENPEGSGFDTAMITALPFRFKERLKPPDAPLPDDDLTRPAGEAELELDAEVPNGLVLQGMAHRIGLSRFIVGRDAPDDGLGLQIPEAYPGLSRQHCRLEFQDGRLVVVDLSTYGTRVNGEPVDGEREVRTGDILELGGAGCKLHLIHILP